jgi:glutamate synthase domain-containing protein 2
MPTPSVDLVKLTQAGMDMVMDDHYDAEGCAKLEEKMLGAMSTARMLQVLLDVVIELESLDQPRPDVRAYVESTYRNLYARMLHFEEQATRHKRDGHDMASLTDFQICLHEVKSVVEMQDQVRMLTMDHDSLVEAARETGTSLAQ